MSNVLSLESLPEELLERILWFGVVAPPRPTVTRPVWHLARQSSSTSRPVPSRLTPLLVNSTFYRIALPLYYHTIHLTTSYHSTCLRTLFLRNAFLSRCVRSLVVSCITSDTHLAVRLCEELTGLDVTLDPFIAPRLAEGFCETLGKLRRITSFTLRKEHNMYLTMPTVRQFVTQVARAIGFWLLLENVHLAFRISDDSGSEAGAMTLIVRALSVAPCLRTFTTELPNVWNEAILCVSANPSLERIILGVGSERSGGLYMHQVRKHPHLAELIRNGSPLMRGRAFTMVGPSKLCLPEEPVNLKSPQQVVARHRSLKRGGRFD